MSSFEHLPPDNTVSSDIPDPSNDQSRMKAMYAALRDEHERLDQQITELELTQPGIDSLELQRLKKRKLMLKDRIIGLKRWLTPDIIA